MGERRSGRSDSVEGAGSSGRYNLPDRNKGALWRIVSSPLSFTCLCVAFVLACPPFLRDALTSELPGRTPALFIQHPCAISSRSPPPLYLRLVTFKTQTAGSIIHPSYTFPFFVVLLSLCSFNVWLLFYLSPAKGNYFKDEAVCKFAAC